MATEIKSKSEVAMLASKLNSESIEFSSLSDSIKSNLNSVVNFDGIDVSSSANILSNNLSNIAKDLDAVSKNIMSYIEAIIGFDIDDFGGNNIESYLENVEGNVINLPPGLGSALPFMGWQCITSKSSTQYKLREAAGMNFDENGFGIIGDRYVVATTSTFGNVGDYIDVVQEDGTIIKCIIGDIKNQNDAGCNKWGHMDGQAVVEFIVDKSTWYPDGESLKRVTEFHPEWSQNITQIINKGSYFYLSEQYDVNTTSAQVSNNCKTWTKLATDSSAIGGIAYNVTQSGSAFAPYIVKNEPTIINVTTSDVEISSGNSEIDLSKYHNNISLGFKVSVDNKIYELNEADFELLCAVVAAESDGTYDDSLAVITTILNRCEDPLWSSSCGTSPIDQIKAANQFSAYEAGGYKKFMNDNVPQKVMVAVQDALAGVRNHEYFSFRSNQSINYSSNMITVTGNRYN